VKPTEYVMAVTETENAIVAAAMSFFAAKTRLTRARKNRVELSNLALEFEALLFKKCRTLRKLHQEALR
jgi:hypothetical protein